MQTIIAAFDDRSTAQQAIERLLAAGFSHDEVHLQHGYDADTSATTESSDTHRSFFGAIQDFFTHIFSADTAGHAGRYTEAVRRGNSVVVVDAFDDSAVGKAREVLSQLDPVDIDDRASQWRNEGWAGLGASGTPAENEDVDSRTPVSTGGVRVVPKAGETPVSRLFSRGLDGGSQGDGTASPDFRQLREGTLSDEPPTTARLQAASDELTRPSLAGQPVPRRTLEAGLNEQPGVTSTGVSPTDSR